MKISENGVERNMTADEITQYEQTAADDAEITAAAEAKAAALVSALAKLAALGLTDAEISALIGA